MLGLRQAGAMVMDTPGVSCAHTCYKELVDG